MKLATVLVIVLPALAVAQTPTGNVLRASITTTCAGSPCSGTAPSADTDGFPVSQRRALALRLCAASGQSLSGGGALDVYSGDEDDGLWSLNPALAITVPASAAGKRCVIVLSDTEVLVGFGRVAVVPNAVPLSGGNLTLKYITRVKVLP